MSKTLQTQLFRLVLICVFCFAGYQFFNLYVSPQVTADAAMAQFNDPSAVNDAAQRSLNSMHLAASVIFSLLPLAYILNIVRTNLPATGSCCSGSVCEGKEEKDLA